MSNAKQACGSEHLTARRKCLAVVIVVLIALMRYSDPGSASTAKLDGNWAVKAPRSDGTVSKAYFNLKYEGSRISGTIRATQFYYTITESTGGPEGFTVVAKMKDGRGERTVRYEGKIVGEELHLSTRRRPEDKPTESVARRVPDGEGAMPARLPLPPLKKIPYNGLAKTPPMGWNSWNLFRGRVNDEIVRGIADAMVTQRHARRGLYLRQYR